MKQPTNWDACEWTIDTIPTSTHFRCILEAIRERQSLSNPADMPYPAGPGYADLLFLSEPNITLTYYQIGICFYWLNYLFSSLCGFNNIGEELYPESSIYNTSTKSGTGLVDRGNRPIWCHADMVEIYEDNTAGKFDSSAMIQQARMVHSLVEEGESWLPIAKNSLINTKVIMKLLIRYKEVISKLTCLAFRDPEVINGYDSATYSQKCGQVDLDSAVYTEEEIFGEVKWDEYRLIYPDFQPGWDSKSVSFSTNGKSKISNIEARADIQFATIADHPNANREPEECLLYYGINGYISFNCGNATIPYLFQKNAEVSVHIYSKSTTYTCTPYTHPETGITEHNDFEEDDEPNKFYWDFGTGLTKGWNNLGSHIFGDMINLLPKQGFGNKEPNQPEWFGTYPLKFSLSWGIDMIKFDFTSSLNFK